ncbi:hypothetical protein FRC03_008215 [Tulasnella sp. 419]|nr:hypothetical protein FRC03_008215 [Tulasnella sp. 419]
MLGSFGGQKKFGRGAHRGPTNNPVATSSTQCQKCLQRGHFTYQCTFKRPYKTRPSRTQLLENPDLAKKLKPSVDIPEEFKSKAGTANEILQAKEKDREKKRKR